MSFTPSKPHFKLKVKAKSGATATIGAGWLNEDSSSISLRLDPGACLRWDDELVITLFPDNRKMELVLGSVIEDLRERAAKGEQ